MKVIDLLNKIADKEPIPNEIKLECVNSINEHNCIYKFNPILETYVNKENVSIQNATCFATLLSLDVEVIEEDKKIEKVNTYVLCDYDFKNKDEDNNLIATNIIDKAFEEYSHKINEIIDKINKGE